MDLGALNRRFLGNNDFCHSGESPSDNNQLRLYNKVPFTQWNRLGVFSFYFLMTSLKSRNDQIELFRQFSMRLLAMNFVQQNAGPFSSRWKNYVQTKSGMTQRKLFTISKIIAMASLTLSTYVWMRQPDFFQVSNDLRPKHIFAWHLHKYFVMTFKSSFFVLCISVYGLVASCLDWINESF